MDRVLGLNGEAVVNLRESCDKRLAACTEQINEAKSCVKEFKALDDKCTYMFESCTKRFDELESTTEQLRQLRNELEDLPNSLDRHNREIDHIHGQITAIKNDIVALQGSNKAKGTKALHQCRFCGDPNPDHEGRHCPANPGNRCEAIVRSLQENVTELKHKVDNIAHHVAAHKRDGSATPRRGRSADTRQTDLVDAITTAQCAAGLIRLRGDSVERYRSEKQSSA